MDRDSQAGFLTRHASRLDVARRALLVEIGLLTGALAILCLVAGLALGAGRGPRLLVGGVALAAASAMQTGKNWIIVRNSKKDYGTSKLVEGVLKAGDVVLLVEDIATTGGQVLEAAKVITDAGAKVEKIVCVIDRKQGARENITSAGYTFESIITKDDLGITD